MKRILLLLMMAMTMLPITAQNDTISLSVANTIKGNEVTFGSDLNNQPMTAYSLHFSLPAFACYPSPDGKQLLVALRPKNKKGQWVDDGMLNLYEQGDTVPRWSTVFHFDGLPTSDGAVMPDPVVASQFTSHGILLGNGNRYMLLNIADGTKLWEQKIYPVYKDDSLDILVGYNKGTSSKLFALRLSTGEKLWETAMAHAENWGWPNAKVLPDHRIAVANNALEILDVTTGGKTTIDTQCGINQTAKAFLGSMALALAGGVALGVAGVTAGYYATPILDASAIAEVHSQIELVDGGMLFADRDALRRISNDGTVQWETLFPKKTAGNSVLVVRGDTVTVASNAMGLRAGQLKSVGTPFVANYNIATGEQIDFHEVAGHKESIAGWKVGREGAFFIGEDRLLYQSFATTAPVMATWNSKAFGKPLWSPTDTVYTFRLTDDQLTPLCNDDDHFIVCTDKLLMKVVDRKLNITDDYDAKNYYRKVLDCGHDRSVVMSVDCNGVEDFWLIHKDGRAQAHITVPVQSLRLADDSLFILSNDRVFSIPLTL